MQHAEGSPAPPRESVVYDEASNTIRNISESAIQLVMRTDEPQFEVSSCYCRLAAGECLNLDYMKIGTSGACKLCVEVMKNDIKEFYFFRIPERRRESQSTGKLVSYPSVLTFFAHVQNDKIDNKLIISGCDMFELSHPDWISIKEPVEVDIPIACSILQSPSAKKRSMIEVTAEGYAPLRIPVLYYRERSAISFEDRIEMKWTKDNAYSANVKVTNNGKRTGFVVLTLEEQTDMDILIRPSAAILLPGATDSFELIVKTEVPQEITIPINVIHGDEIMRQMVALISPKDFLAYTFQNIEVIDEIGEFKNDLLQMKKKDFINAYKNHIKTDSIELFSQKPGQQSSILVSPQKLEFVGSETLNISIINLSSSSTRFMVYCPSPHVVISPLDGSIQGFSHSILEVKLTAPVTSAIDIESNDTVNTVSVSRLSSQFIVNPNSFFEIDEEEVAFGLVPVGETRKINFQVKNLTAYPLHMPIVRIGTRTGVFAYPRHVKIPAMSSSSVLITFTPDAPLQYAESLSISYSGQTATFNITGQGITSVTKKLVEAESKTLSFPDCLVGTQLAARIKVLNRSENKVNVTALVSKPFLTKISRFSIEPRSYVLFPVIFDPNKTGKYTEELKFFPDDQIQFTVLLRGTGI